jgi:glucose/arabinose dehydrogenase
MLEKKRLFFASAVLLLIGAACRAPAASVAPTAVPRTAAPVTPQVTLAATPAATEASTATPAETAPAVETATTEPTAAPTANASLKPALQLFVDGLEKPTYLTHAGDGSGLLYVTEQPGRVRIVRDGTRVETPFLDIEDKVGSSGNEQGLLSIAFAPDFQQSRKIFANYTDRNGDTIVAGFLVSADGLSADPASEWQVIKIEQPYANHNGGQIKFGPDGMLYIGMGDGGSAGDPQNHAQDVTSLLGKMLRIDVAQSTKDAPYVVPATNPDFGADAKPEIWSVGLRNPWRFSFDRSSGDMLIADVGQNEIEEVNWQPAASTGGENWGWKLREGLEEFSGDKTDAMTDPVHEYRHGEDGCSVTGGYVYHGAAVPALAGVYLYGDFCSGRIWTLRAGADGAWTNELLLDTDYSITSFGEDAQGELYVLDRAGGIYKLVGE